MKEFTFIEIANWRKYEKMRQSGRFNMWFPQPRTATGLTESEYLFSLKNYSELKEAAKDEIV